VNEPLQWILLIIAAYLIGSIPFGFLIGKLRGIDIREHGSKNIGATNTGRVLGKKWGFLCFILDVAKGFAPTFFGGLWMGCLDPHWQSEILTIPAPTQQFLWIGVGIAAILGHMFPLYLKLRGGKGVATAFGVMMGIYPFLTWPVFGALLVWIIIVRIFRMISLASILAAFSLPIWLLISRIPRDADIESSHNLITESQKVWPFFIITIALALLILLRHRTNISRILKGTEPTISKKKK